MEIKCGISLGHTIYNILRENKILSRFYFFSFLTLSLPRTRYLATTMSLVQLRGQVISLSQCSLLGALNVHIYICILYYIIFILIIHILLLYYNIETIRYSSQFLFCGSINEIFFMYTSLFVLLCLSLGVNNTMLLIRQFERDFLFVIDLDCNYSFHTVFRDSNADEQNVSDFAKVWRILYLPFTSFFLLTTKFLINGFFILNFLNAKVRLPI